MENLEQYWEQSFSPIGRKFTEIRPNYQDMGETDSMVAALYWLELEMYNGGFLQFFCNWGYDAYLLAIWKSHATLTLLATQDCPLWLQYD